MPVVIALVVIVALIGLANVSSLLSGTKKTAPASTMSMRPAAPNAQQVNSFQIQQQMSEDKLDVDPNITDKELDLLLHKQLAEIEGSIASEGHEVMNFGMHETPDQYRSRLASYLGKVDDLKKSDLANYVFHRKVILDILEQTIRRGSDGKYAREELIHELIIPMRKTSNDVLSDGYRGADLAGLNNFK